MIRRTPMQRGSRRLGARAQARVRSGGVLARGRRSLPLEEYRDLKARVLERDGGRCVWCETPYAVFDADHVIPRSHGGPDTGDNLITLCRYPCHGLRQESFSRGRLQVHAIHDACFRLELWRGEDKGSARVVQVKEACYCGTTWAERVVPMMYTTATPVYSYGTVAGRAKVERNAG